MTPEGRREVWVHDSASLLDEFYVHANAALVERSTASPG